MKTKIALLALLGAIAALVVRHRISTHQRRQQPTRTIVFVGSDFSLPANYQWQIHRPHKVKVFRTSKPLDSVSVGEITDMLVLVTVLRHAEEVVIVFKNAATEGTAAQQLAEHLAAAWELGRVRSGWRQVTFSASPYWRV